MKEISVRGSNSNMSRSEQHHALCTALDLIRTTVPNSIRACISTSDQDYYGFVLVDVELTEDELLSRTGDELLCSLNDDLFEHLADLDWDGVVGEDKHGLAFFPLDGPP